MKFKICFKTPHVVDQLVDQLRRETLKEEMAAHELAWETLNKFVKHEELIEIEFDTETGEAKVVKL